MRMRARTRARTYTLSVRLSVCRAESSTAHMPAMLAGAESDALPFVLDSEPASGLDRHSSGLSPPGKAKAVSTAGMHLPQVATYLPFCCAQVGPSCCNATRTSTSCCSPQYSLDRDGTALAIGRSAICSQLLCVYMGQPYVTLTGASGIPPAATSNFIRPCNNNQMQKLHEAAATTALHLCSTTVHCS